MSGIGPLLAALVFHSARNIPVLVAGYRLVARQIFNKLRLANDSPENRLNRYLAILNPQTVFIKNRKIPSVPKILSKMPLGVINRYKNAADFDRFWRTAREQYPITVERTFQYLDWRFFQNPLKYEILSAYRDSELQGYIIWRVEAITGFKIARVVDFIALPKSEDILVQALFIKLNQQKIDAADFFSSGNFHIAALERNGFFNIIGTAFEDVPSLFNPLSDRKNYINFWMHIRNPNMEPDPSDCYFTKAEGDQDRANPHL